MSADEKVTGGCQCGAVRYELQVPPENAHACHCRMCQKATGGLFAALAGAPKDKVRWIAGTPTFFQSSNLAKRGFCPSCGTPLTFAYDDPKARLYVTIGSLDDPETAPITRQYGVEAKLSFVEFCEELLQEKTGEDPGFEDFFDNMQSNQFVD